MVTLEQEKLELLSDLEEYFQDPDFDVGLLGITFFQTHPVVMLDRARQILMKEKLASEVIIDFKKFLTQERPDAS